MQGSQHNEEEDSSRQIDTSAAAQGLQQRGEQNESQVEEEKADTSWIVRAESAYLIMNLTDENVMKVIQKSVNSPHAGLSSNEILNALGDIEGARRHLGQLLIE